MQKLFCFTLVSVLALSACGTEEDKPSIPAQLSWQSGLDHSFYASRPLARGIEAGRCWSAEKGFDCLFVSSALGIEIGAWRWTGSVLPSDIPDGQPGYQCNFSPDYGITTEEIWGRDGKLTSTDSTILRSKYWTSEFVRSYMKKNNVGGGAYFDCPKLMRILNRGSLATLNTTGVTKGILSSAY